MAIPLHDALHAALCETFENMAFVEVHLREDAELEAVRSATLLILAPFPGEIDLNVPSELLDQLARTIYGMDAAEATPEVLDDLLMEVLNTVTGRFLTHLLPPEQEYRLGIPEAGAGGAFVKDAEMTLNFECENIPFTLTLRGEELLKYTPAA